MGSQAAIARVSSAMAVILLMLVPQAMAADVSGVWRGDVRLPTGQTLPFVARLMQDGDAVTGRLDGIAGAPDVEVKDGKADGDRITFSGVRDINGMPVKFTYTGTVIDADTLDFVIVREDGAQAPLSTRTRRSPD